MPHIPLVAVGGQLLCRNAPGLTGEVDGLNGLSRYTGGIFVAAAAPPAQTLQGGRGNRLGNRAAVKVIPLCLGKLEHMLIATAAAVNHALRHGVAFLPDDVAAQIPAVLTERQRQPPRDAQHVLDLCALTGVLAVGIGNVQPEGAVLAEHPVDLAEYLHQPPDIRLRGSLAPDLPLHPVVPEGVIGRRGNTAVDAVVRQGLEDGKAVALQNGIGGDM